MVGKIPIFCCFLLIFFCRENKLFASDPPKKKLNYYAELISVAQTKKLSQKRYWHILLHYRKNLLGGFESEVDGQSFFNAPDGKTNPKAELEATLKAFFTPKGNKINGLHPQCLFKARFDWLDQELVFDRDRINLYRCPRFEKWRDTLKPHSVSLIFSSFFLKTPGSMFGHTLLRINGKGNNSNPLLDYAINYSASVDIDRENPIIYSILGIFGGYDGYFSIMPYYAKVQEYSDFEMRDIWEYQLELSTEEVSRLVKHNWELMFTGFDYFFFKENCSYHLLSLVEAARPSLDLRSDYHFVTIPTDTIRQLYKVPNLISRVVYRPSRYSRLLFRLEQLTEKEREIFYEAIDNSVVLNGRDWEALPVKSQALILEGLSDYYVIQGTTEDRAKRFPLLKKRAALKVVLPDIRYQPRSAPPEEGHLSARAGLGGGWNSNLGEFLQLEIRPSFHDLLANDTGFLPNSEIEFLKTSFRKYRKKEDILELDHLTGLSIISLTPRSRLLSTLSWKGKVYWERIKDEDCTGCGIFTGGGGIGLSYRLGPGVWYGMAEAYLKSGQAYETNIQLEGGVGTGYLATLGERFKLGLFASSLKEVYDQKRSNGLVYLGLNYSPFTNGELRAEIKKERDIREGILSAYYYF